MHLGGFCYKNISWCTVLWMSKMYSIIIWPNGPYSSLQLCQTCPFPTHDTAHTHNVPLKHCHLIYWLTNQTSTIFWNSGHCPLSMAKSTQCLTGWLYTWNGERGALTLVSPLQTAVSITGISITPMTSYHCCNLFKVILLLSHVPSG